MEDLFGGKNKGIHYLLSRGWVWLSDQAWGAISSSAQWLQFWSQLEAELSEPSLPISSLPLIFLGPSYIADTKLGTENTVVNTKDASLPSWNLQVAGGADPK